VTLLVHQQAEQLSSLLVVVVLRVMEAMPQSLLVLVVLRVETEEMWQLSVVHQWMGLEVR
jgi:hypothetical protein